MRGFSAIWGVKAVSKAAADSQTPNIEGFSKISARNG
jgi:hypothetical protein